ncbi:fam-a protein [Plasmodium vinckei lentum]|uniref:Fam-a protein n=1 Tax=Plasmodium vinckei lentum TaxID=138297 RepID=A0A6V7RZK3_PLAVN|nr:fam-a protein [Plasmodium vinckei lentum]
MNKFYIQIVLFLLSISIYLSNKTLATESAPEENTTPESKNRYATSEEIHEENKQLLCTDPEETKQAIKLMSEAVMHLVYHATSEKGYELCCKFPENQTFFYKKKHDNQTNVGKIQYTINNLNKYDQIINKIWSPDQAIFFNKDSVKIVRVYNPNLVMIQQRYKKKLGSRQKYFYALATKVEISEDATIIVMTSPNINDHNPSTKEYKNTIIENANLFKTDIDSEDDIRNGKLKKVFVNIAGYHIEKKDNHIDINYVESIDGHNSICQECFIGAIYNCDFLPS